MKMLRIRSCRKSRQYLYKWRDNKSKCFKQKKGAFENSTPVK